MSNDSSKDIRMAYIKFCLSPLFEDNSYKLKQCTATQQLEIKSQVTKIVRKTAASYKAFLSEEGIRYVKETKDILRAANLIDDASIGMKLTTPFRHMSFGS